MSRAGRKPTPTALKVIAGNPGHRRLPENEPTPPAGAAMPDDLSPAAAAVWLKVAQQLEDAGVLTQIDACALALYCETYSRWRDASNQVIKFGAIVKAPSGFPVQSPYLAIANRAHDQMVTLLVEFGMTPSSRSRVNATPPKKKVNKFTALLASRKS